MIEKRLFDAELDRISVAHPFSARVTLSARPASGDSYMPISLDIAPLHRTVVIAAIGHV